MTDTKRPCADCTNVEPCDILERCIKHDPAPKVHDEYAKLDTPGGMHLEPCPVCAANAELWQYMPKPDAPAQKVVCCEHSDDIGPHDALAGGGCPLYMPPLSFYRPTIREAVKHWNEYAKALGTLRRSNGWRRGRVLRDASGVPGTDWRGPTGAETDAEFAKRSNVGTFNSTGWEPTDLNSFKAGVSWAHAHYRKWRDADGVDSSGEVPTRCAQCWTRDDVEAVADCLGDDAAQLREANDEDERADNMDRAASMLTWMLLTHPAYADGVLASDMDYGGNMGIEVPDGVLELPK